MVKAALELGGLEIEDELEGEPLEMTKKQIDNYLTQQHKLGKQKLMVSEDYASVPLEYQYLNQYHDFKNPLSGTFFGPRYGLPGALWGISSVSPQYVHYAGGAIKHGADNGGATQSI